MRTPKVISKKKARACGARRGIIFFIKIIIIIMKAHGQLLSGFHKEMQQKVLLGDDFYADFARQFYRFTLKIPARG